MSLWTKCAIESEQEEDNWWGNGTIEQDEMSHCDNVVGIDVAVDW